MAKVDSIKGYAFELTYDPDLWHLMGEKVEAGQILECNSSDAETFFVSRTFEESNGLNRILVANMIAGRNGNASGTSDLSSFSFVSKAGGYGDIKLERLVVVDGGRNIYSHPEGGWVQTIETLKKPQKTELAQNYPNPFNPETWLPYKLSQQSHVSIRIYDATGILVKELNLGIMPAGDYSSQGFAAYWDGRNANGEQVASGVYFYELQTDHQTSLKKMVILK